jgi:4-amino-4-deoxy-L-arabinose transferase-like glycosyltransferase
MGVPLATRTRADVLALTGALIVAVGLRLPYFTLPLGRDEGGVAWVAQQWFTGHGSLYGSQWLDRPPLLVALYRIAVPGGTIGIRLLGTVAALAIVLGVFLLARRLGGDRAARIAALVAAVLTGAKALAAVFAPAELIASAPAVWSILALVTAHQTGRLRPLALAGLLAMAALLVKQSFLDAGLAGIVYLVATRRWRAWAAYSAGAAAALVPVGLWLLLAHLRVSALLDALFGFRAQSLTVLQDSNLSLWHRMHGLRGPALYSGLIFAVPVAIAGLARLRADRVLIAVLSAWLLGGTVGVLAGGSYWPHYLIQLVAVASVGTGLALAAVRHPRWRSLLAVATAAALLVGAAVLTVTSVGTPRQTDAAVARWVKAHARPGDSFYALYAQANLNYAVGLHTPFPYSWSLMMRGRPDAHARLLALLRSPQRPTWVVQWQHPSTWHLDPGGRIKAELHRYYRRVYGLHGHPVLRSRA